MMNCFFNQGRIPLAQDFQQPAVGAASTPRSIQAGIAAWTPLLREIVDARAVTAPRLNVPASQRGSALFVGVFLIAVVAVLAVAVALTSVTQQTGAVRAFEAEQAWYAALGRIEAEAPGILANGACPGGGAQQIAGFTTTLGCAQSGIVQEGGQNYTVFSLAATAEKGSAAAGNLVRRTARAQLTNAD